MSKRKAHGAKTMRGLKLSELELGLMAEAGISLAVAARNSHLARELGLAWTLPKLPLWNLHQHSLPEAFLSMMNSEVIATNATIISQTLTLNDNLIQEEKILNPRRLVLAFDRTYLLQGLDVVALRTGKGFVGTAFRIPTVKSITSPEDAPERRDGDDGFLPLRETGRPGQFHGWDVGSDAPAAEQGQQQEETGDAWDAASLLYANEMAEFVLFDGALERLPRFSLCCVPVGYKTSSLDMLILLGTILQKGGQFVRTLTMDNATSHSHIKRFLLGQNVGLSEQQVADLPFWNCISYKPFPPSCLPRFRYRRPYVGEDCLYLACIQTLTG